MVKFISGRTNTAPISNVPTRNVVSQQYNEFPIPARDPDFDEITFVRKPWGSTVAGWNSNCIAAPDLCVNINTGVITWTPSPTSGYVCVIYTLTDYDYRSCTFPASACSPTLQLSTVEVDFLIRVVPKIPGNVPPVFSVPPTLPNIEYPIAIGQNVNFDVLAQDSDPSQWVRVTSSWTIQGMRLLPNDCIDPSVALPCTVSWVVPTTALKINNACLLAMDNLLYMSPFHCILFTLDMIMVSSINRRDFGSDTYSPPLLQTEGRVRGDGPAFNGAVWLSLIGANMLDTRPVKVPNTLFKARIFLATAPTVQIGADISSTQPPNPAIDNIVVVSATRIDVRLPPGFAATYLNPGSPSPLGVIIEVSKDGYLALPRFTKNQRTFTFKETPFITSFSPASGSECGGITITIQGYFYGLGVGTITQDAIRRVDLGCSAANVCSTPCSSVNVNANQDTILCLVPSGLGPGGYIRVITPYADNLATGVRTSTVYTVRPRPVVTSVTPLYGPIEDITIKGLNFGAAKADLISITLGGVPMVPNSDFTWINPTTISAVARNNGTVGTFNFIVTTTTNCPSLPGPGTSFTFVSPNVTAVNIVTRNGGSITLSGYNFGSKAVVQGGVPPVVTVSGRPLNFPLWVNSNRITALASPGLGAFRNGTLKIGGFVVPFYLTYLPAFTLTRSMLPFAPMVVRGPAASVSGFINIEAVDPIHSISISSLSNSIVLLSTPSFDSNRTLTYAPSTSKTGTAKATVVVKTISMGVIFTAPTDPAGHSFELTVVPYPEPQITAVSPDSWSNCGGTTMTVWGQYLAETAADLRELLVGPSTCVVTTWVSDKEIRCLRPPGSSGRFTLTSTVGRSIYEKVATLTLAPIVASVDPAWNHAMMSTDLTVRGTNLGLDAADLKGVTLGTLVCATPVWVSGSEVRCKLPPLMRPGSLPITVDTVGFCSGTSGTFVWEPPVVTGVRPASDTILGGATVTIFGARLGSAMPNAFTAPTLAGQPCSLGLTFLTPTSIKCTTSPGGSKASGPVLLTTAQGGLSLSTATFTFTPPVPSITAVAPTLFVRTGGDQVTVYGVLFIYQPDTPVAIFVGDGVPCTDPRRISQTSAVCSMPSFQDVADSGAPQGLFTPQIDGVMGPAFQATLSFFDKGIEFRWGSNMTNEDKGTVEVEVFLSLPPVDTVDVSLEVPNSAEARVVNRVVSFDTNTYDVPRTITIMGVMDARRDGFQDFDVITLPAVSTDPNFDRNNPLDFKLTNQDSKPVITAVKPRNSYLVGVPMTIFGYNFDRNLSLDFEGAVIRDRDITKIFTRNPLWVEPPPPPKPLNLSSNASSPAAAAAAPSSSESGYRAYVDYEDIFSITFVAPPAKAEGYVDVTALNLLARTESTKARLVFYTDDCPEEGMYGRGTSCVPCPTGATCPGGFRLRPLPGFWNVDESSTFVEKCRPAESCAGYTEDASGVGRGDQCNFPYRGFKCYECAPGYVRKGGSVGRCVPCPSRESILIKLCVLCLTWMFVSMCTWWIEETVNLDYVADLVLTLQCIGGVGGTVSTVYIDSKGKLAILSVKIIDALAIFSGNIKFAQLSCLSEEQTTTYLTDFTAAMGFNLAVAVPMVAFIPVVSAFSQWWHKPNGPLAVKERTKHFKMRFIRVIILYMVLFFLSFAQIAIEPFLCRRSKSSGRWQLKTRPEVACFTTDHYLTMGVAIFFLLTVVVAFPIVMVSFFMKSGPDRMYNDDNYMKKFDYLYAAWLRPFRFMFVLDTILLSLGIALCDLIFDSAKLQLVAYSAILVPICIAIIVMRPLQRGWENWIQLILHLCNLAQAFLAYIAEKNGSEANKEMMGNILFGTIMGLFLVAFITFVLAVVSIFIRWPNKRYWDRVHGRSLVEDIAVEDDLRKILSELNMDDLVLEDVKEEAPPEEGMLSTIANIFAPPPPQGPRMLSEAEEIERREKMGFFGGIWDSTKNLGHRVGVAVGIVSEEKEK